MKTRERASGRSDRSIPAFLHGYLPTQRDFPQGIFKTYLGRDRFTVEGIPTGAPLWLRLRRLRSA